MDHAGEIEIGEREGTPEDDRARVAMRIHTRPSIASALATKTHQVRTCRFNLHIASRIVFENERLRRNDRFRSGVTPEKKKESEKPEGTHRESV